MKPNNSTPESRASGRRLIERLSGWRLIAFFVSMALNLGLLVGMLVWPLYLDEWRLFVAAAWVSASHAVFLTATAGFRFSISTKVALGLAHATACLWALASIDALPWVRCGNHEVTTLYLIPMVTLMVTIGGVFLARLKGYHRSRKFSVTDLLLLVTEFAILFPLILQLVPRGWYTDGVSAVNLESAIVFATATGVTCLAISNLCLALIPSGEYGLSSLMLVIGWFLFVMMIDWSLWQFSFLVAIWILVSLFPVTSIIRDPVVEQ